MSKIRIQRGKSLNIPIKLEQQFDITGNEMEIKKFSDDTLQQIINPIKDYEVAKFIHDYDDNGVNDLYLAFSFIDGQNTWIDEYFPQGFTDLELSKFSDAVKNSFFKLDFFDSPSREKQKLQFTKIIPMYLSNISEYDRDLDGVMDYRDNMVDVDGDGADDNLAGGVTVDSQTDPQDLVDEFSDRFNYSSQLGQNIIGTYIIPNFYSNGLKNNEISDLFFFKDLATKNISEFYMGCRFFNSKNGDVVRMTNDAIIDSGINPVKDYYYKVVIDRQKRTYQIYDYVDGVLGGRVGSGTNNALMFYQML